MPEKPCIWFHCSHEVIGKRLEVRGACLVALGIIALGEKAGWWHMEITWQPYFLTIMWIDFALGAFVFLITWRIARRFGWRALAALVVFVAIIGPLRDYWYMEHLF